MGSYRSDTKVSSKKRSYQLKERAKRQAETRQRIVEATVALHEEKGPAATTVTEIARRAGVSRLTVYNHFPSDGDLFAACQDEFLTRHPPPDLAATLALADPEERVRETLAAVYRSYRRREPVTAKVLRDRKGLPALDALLARTLDSGQAELARSLAAPLVASGRNRKRVRAAVALALDYSTWERLTREGLTDGGAAQLMAKLVACAVEANSQP